MALSFKKIMNERFLKLNLSHHLILCSMISLIIFSSCTQKISSVSDKSAAQIEATYQVLRDVPYGEDTQQIMDIYLSKDALSYRDKNYTIVFLHGGAFYLSDKSKEEKYIEPYLKKGLNVVNMNYRLKKGVAMATSDLSHALNFLNENNAIYPLNLQKVIVTGFSAGAQIATNVGLSQNNDSFPDQLDQEIEIKGIINFSGPVDDLDVIEKIFIDYDYELFSKAGKALFPTEGYASKEVVAVYEPISYFDENDPAIFLWHGGKDVQIPPPTFTAFTAKLRENKDVLTYIPDGKHSPSATELEEAYSLIFQFLDNLKTKE
jgi:acetyl esterase/lipase